MAAIDQLIQDLRADGSVDSEGHFTLDREQARAKMQKFQLADPRRYVLELVQAAVLRGATAVYFDIDADDMRMSFDGAPFTAAEFDDLYGSLFADGDSRELRSVRQLALALNAALGMEPKYIHVRSGATELRMVPGQRDEIRELGRADARTEIHVRQRFRLRVFVDFFLNLTGRLGEEQHLRARCVYSTVPVFLDGTKISGGLDHGDRGLASLTVSGADYRGVLRIVERSEACELRLVKDGVWIDSQSLPYYGTHLIAVIEGDNLRKDVSQARIVESAALERIHAVIAHARWRLWTLARDARQGEPRRYIDALIRGQLLESSTRAELSEDEHCRALAAELAWSDCRDLGHRTSLAELAVAAGTSEVVRYARRSFEGIAYQAPPVLLLEDASDGVRLRRVLEIELVAADELLAREQRRAQGRHQWLARKAEPELPTHVSYAVRSEFRASHEGKPVWGQVGVDMDLWRHEDLRAPVHVFWHKQGRLLGRAELELGLDNLWLAIEAELEPNDDYTGAVPDKVYIHALLLALASLAEPLAQALIDAPDPIAQARTRGLAKRWLAAMVDRGAQIPLLTRAGADVRNDFFVPGLVPGLDGAALRDPAAPLAKLAELRLFDTLDGAGASLCQVLAHVAERGQLEYVEHRPTDPRLQAAGVAVLGTGDRKLLRALIGEARLRVWDAEAKLRELEFWDREPIRLADARARAARALVDAGITDPSAWVAEIAAGPTVGFVTVTLAADPEGGPAAAMVVHRDERRLCQVAIDGPSGLVAVVTDPRLEPSPGFDDVVRDGGFAAVAAAIARAGEQLLVGLAAHVDAVPPGPRTRLVELLRGAAVGSPSLRAQLTDAPLFTTLDGARLSLAEVTALVERHGRLGYVRGEILGDDVEAIAGAPILRVEDDAVDEVRALLDDRLEDASERVRHRAIYALLADRPALTEATLDPDPMLVRAPFVAAGQIGELGIPGDRTGASLVLRLGFAGREVGTIEDRNGFFAAIDAVVIDDQLALDPEGRPKPRANRTRGLVRALRRRVPELIVALCDRFPELRGDPREQAWATLLGYLAAEAKANEDRRLTRQEAVARASAVAWFRDVGGGRRSLTELRGRNHARPIDALSADRFAGVCVDDLAFDRPVVIVDAHELACLQAHGEVRLLDEVWDAELEAQRRLAAAPAIAAPDLDAVALAYRKATVAGGLEAELWIPRTCSPLADPEGALTLKFARAGREIGAGAVNHALACQGIVRGDGLDALAGEIELDERQRASLERQQLILYLDLADKVDGGRLGPADHERALVYLAWAACLGEAEIHYSHGKYVGELQRQLARLVAPSLRAAVGRRLAPEPAPKPAPKPAPEPAIELAPGPERSLAPSPSPAGAEGPAEPARTPEQRLLASIYAELRWARARHQLLDSLLVDRMRLGSWSGPEIGVIDAGSLLLNRDHPLVARLLGAEADDPIDLHFVVAAVYSLLNYDADEISDDDEREFVAQLAETLAIEARA